MRPDACNDGADPAAATRTAWFDRWVVLAGIILASCGGGSNGYQELVNEANAKEAQARVLATTAPCSSVDQCGMLVFYPVSGSCNCPALQPYSLVSATAAAASAAATEQASLAGQALSLSGDPPFACFCAAPPRLACVASQCQAGY